MADATPLRVRFDAFELDEANARLTRDGQPIALPPKAFAVLCTLARRQGQLVTKNALLDAVWGHQHVSESLLKNIISSVRAALSDDAKAPRYIETASRFGYRFIAITASTAVASPPAAAQGSPVVPRPTSGASIVGREAALAKMRETWQKALAGQRQLLWIAGEAGVGKTTLIESFVSEMPPRTAAFGRCVEHFGTGEPYLPVLEVLKEICRLEPELTRLMRTIAPTWLIQMPWFVSEAERVALHRELAGAHPDRMLREIRELMDHFSATRPICFILEDMHWSDLGTLRMMEHFARRPRAVPILWIASFRLAQIIAENHPLRGLRQELRVQKLCEEIVLDPFSEAEVDTYLRNRLPKARFPSSFVRRLHGHTDGLPLFVVSVADTLAEQAEKDPVALERWQADPNGPLPVPESLAGVIEKQAAGLPPEVQAMLEAASVCGTEFRAGIVANMIEREPQWVRERCDDLVRRQIWVRQVSIVELPDGEFDSRYAFLHALYQHVLYERLAMSQRVQHHRRAARALSSGRVIGESLAPAELASHYERGHAIPAALRAYAEAAGLALAHFAPRDSAYLAAHGLSLLNRCPEGEERMELELALMGHSGLAASQLHGVASDEARAAFARVQALCDQLPQTPARALTLTGLGWIFYVRGEFDQALALATRLEEIATLHEHATLFVLTCNLRGVALSNTGRLTAACEWLERGIEKCTELPEEARAALLLDPEVSMRFNAGFPLVNLGFPGRARRHMQLGQQRAERLGEPMSVMLAHWTSGMAEARLNNLPEVARHAAGLAKVVESAMLPQALGPSLWLRGLAEARGGDPRTGHEHIMKGYESHARLGMYCGCAEVLGYATEALFLAEDWSAARKRVEEGLSLANRIDDRIAIPDLFLLQARIELAAKDVASARRAMLAGLQEARTQEARWYELTALLALAELEDSGPDDLTALETAHRQMTEGLDTQLYRRAGELLAARKPPR
jgi:DNA-binding winged helix-turn-helix (wHTH) protein/tetratricopeptide (TPR) repeat protein